MTNMRAGASDGDDNASSAGLAKRVAEGASLLRSGSLDLAHAVCAEVLATDAANIEALALAAEVAFASGVSDDAIKWLRAGVEAHPAEADLHYKLGCLRDDAGDYEGAVHSFRAALHFNPRFAKGHNNLGATLQKLGRMDEALASFVRARDLDAKLWQAHYNIGNFHKLAGNLEDAISPFQAALRLRRSPEQQRPELSGLFATTSRSKLLHDIEQLSYLLENGIIAQDHWRAVETLRRVLTELEPAFERTGAVLLPPHLVAAAAGVYNRLLNFYDAPRLGGPAVNSRLDTATIEADYFQHAPGITYVDDFLTPSALQELRRFCMESTVWYDGVYSTGYVGASLEEGFICPLLAQIAAELPRALPGIFGSHKLTHLWGYKYDSERSGIEEHADFAAVNVNFWLTPDDANLNAESGGLVVWNKEAPLDWDFDDYNQDPSRIRRFLDASKASAVVVPHRQNRVVIFNSDLFHKTDNYAFRPGYANRRLNVTFLYGYRQTRDDPLARRR